MTSTSSDITTKPTPSEVLPIENLCQPQRTHTQLLISWWSFSLVVSEAADGYGGEGHELEDKHSGFELEGDNSGSVLDDDSDSEEEPEYS